MAIPYSTRFISGALTAPASQTYTVPAGFRALINSVVFATGGTGGVSAVVQAPNGVIVAVTSSMGANLDQSRVIRVVVAAGEQIVAQATVGGVYVTVTGYLLSLT